MTCEHKDQRLTKRVVRTGAVQYVYQCMTCGRSMNQPLSHERIRREFSAAQIHDFDESIEARYEQIRLAELKKDRADKKAEFFKEYNEYLRSDAWAKKRNRVLARCKGICEGCGDRRATQVHHLTYDHVYDELLFELVGICDQCHERAHAEEKEGEGH